jgi:hypothetical protein
MLMIDLSSLRIIHDDIRVIALPSVAANEELA